MLRGAAIEFGPDPNPARRCWKQAVVTALSVEFSNALKIFNLEKIFNSDNLDKPNMVVGVLGSCHFLGPRFQDAGAVLAMCRIGGRCGVVSWSLSCKRGKLEVVPSFFFGGLPNLILVKEGSLFAFHGWVALVCKLDLWQSQLVWGEFWLLAQLGSRMDNITYEEYETRIEKDLKKSRFLKTKQRSAEAEIWVEQNHLWNLEPSNQSPLVFVWLRTMHILAWKHYRHQPASTTTNINQPSASSHDPFASCTVGFPRGDPGVAANCGRVAGRDLRGCFLDGWGCRFFPHLPGEGL